MPRPKTKTMVATIKLTPEVRAAWEAAARAERRSLANMFEIAIVEYVERNRIRVQPLREQPKGEASAENVSPALSSSSKPSNKPNKKTP